MPMCPTCQVYLDCAFKIETRDEDRPVYTDYQWWRCPDCDARFSAVLVEDKVNLFNDDLDHTGYRVAAEAWDNTLACARRCPTGGRRPCACDAHTAPGLLLPRGSHAW